MKFTIRTRENIFLSVIFSLAFTFFIVIKWPQLAMWEKVGIFTALATTFYLFIKHFGETYWIDDKFLILNPGRYEEKYALKDIKKITRIGTTSSGLISNNTIFLIFKDERVEVNSLARSQNGVYIEKHLRRECKMFVK